MFCLDTSDQLTATKSILQTFLGAVDSNNNLEGAVRGALEEGKFNIDLQWSDGTQSNSATLK